MIDARLVRESTEVLSRTPARGGWLGLTPAFWGSQLRRSIPFHLTVTDQLSGIADCTGRAILTGEGAAQTAVTACRWCRRPHDRRER